VSRTVRGMDARQFFMGSDITTESIHTIKEPTGVDKDDDRAMARAL
jgi:hypothetical protein